MSTERDLADAIYYAIISDDSVADALSTWHRGPLDNTLRMRFVLASSLLSATEAVLARRQREAARTGPWDDATEEEWRSRLATQCGQTLAARDERDVAVRKLAEIMAARTGSWEGPRVDLQYGRMQDALERIISWSEAYPLDIFPEPDLAKVRELLKAGGITLDAVSAHCMRHVIDGVGKIARAAARAGPWDAP